MAAFGIHLAIIAWWHQRRARSLDRRGHLTEALPHYEKLTALQPGSAHNQAMLGEAFRKAKDWGRAREAYMAALALKPDVPAWLLKLAGLENALQNRTAAESALLKIPDENRGSAEWHREMARSLDYRGFLTEALPHYEKLTALQPGSAHNQAVLGEAFRKTKDYGRAREAYRAALAIEPERPEWLASLAAMEHVLGNRGKGLELFATACGHAKDDTRLTASAINNYALYGDWPAVCGVIKKTIREHFPEAASSPGQALMWLDRLNMAIKCSTGWNFRREQEWRGLGALLLARNLYRMRVADRVACLDYPLMQTIDRDLGLRHAPSVYMKSKLIVEGQAAIEYFENLFRTEWGEFPPSTWLWLSLELFGLRRVNLARAVAGKLFASGEVIELLPENERTQARWLREFIAREETTDAAPDDKALRLGIMSYKHPILRRCVSRNLGDYTQTLAFLSNLARFSGVRFTGNPALVKIVEDLAARQSRPLSTPGSIRLVEINRDYASGQEYPNPTWYFVFGWHMQAAAQDPFDFPYPENVKPIFLGLHINNQQMLPPAAVRYLRQGQPIGCRDWSTVYILRSHGLLAFFSGCVTSTLGSLFPAPPAPVEKVMLLVDYAGRAREFATQEIKEFKQDYDCVAWAALAENLAASLSALEKYRAHPRIITSRLHTYLPARALGVPVSFRPARPGDIRFEGLVSLSDEQFAHMAENIRNKISAVLSWLLEGVEEKEVYRRWGELCAPDLARAETYCRNVKPLPDPSFDVKAAARDLRARSLAIRPELASRPGCIEAALALDQNLAAYLPAVLRSILAHTKRPLRFHLLLRGLDEEYALNLAELFREASFQFYYCDAIDYGEAIHLLSHITVSTNDRLLLPFLLESLDKVVYLDVDILVLGDIGELYDTELDKAFIPIAGVIGGAPANITRMYSMIEAGIAKLAAEEAFAMRRWIYSRGGLDFFTVNAGVLVMNLALMRALRFCEESIVLMGRCGLDDQNAINILARENRVLLPAEWNYIPTLSFNPAPKLIHFAGSQKPWGPLYVPRQEKWQAFYRDSDALLAGPAKGAP